MALKYVELLATGTVVTASTLTAQVSIPPGYEKAQLLIYVEAASGSGRTLDVLLMSGCDEFGTTAGLTNPDGSGVTVNFTEASTPHTFFGGTGATIPCLVARSVNLLLLVNGTSPSFTLRAGLLLSSD